MGNKNCCPTGNSCAVEKPPHQQNPDIVRQSSIVSGSDGGSYKKRRETGNSIHKTASTPSGLLTHQVEELDLRERTLEDDQNANGIITTQPVSAKHESIVNPSKSDNTNTNVRGSSHDVKEANPQKSKTTTSVFNAGDVRPTSNVPPDTAPTKAADSQDFSFCNQAFVSEQEQEKTEVPKSKTTEVVMRLSHGRTEGEEPGYASVRTVSEASVDSHAYSNADTASRNGAGSHHSARGTGRASRPEFGDEEDDYAAVAYDDDGYAGIVNNEEVDLEMDEVEDEVDYYEIGHPHLKALSMKVANRQDSKGHDEKTDSSEEEAVGTPDMSKVTTDDVYATIDKSRKTSRRRSFPLGQSNDEADRELDEIWMEIEKIEENLCSTLSRDTNSESEEYNEEDKEDFYLTFINDTIEDLSRKNDILWHKQASEVEDYEKASNWANTSEDDEEPTFSSITEVNASYKESVENLNERTAKHLMEPSKRNEEEVMKIISEHRDSQMELYKCREAQKRKLDARLQRDLEKHRSNVEGSDEFGSQPDPAEKMAGILAKDGSDSDSDTERIQASYRGLMTDQGDAMEGEAKIEFSNEASSVSSSDEDSIEGEDQMRAKETLKRTLTVDVAANLDSMSNKDFKKLMSLYRESRQDIKKTREADKSKWDQSLWETLAQRRKEVDQYVHENDSDGDERNTKSSDVKHTQTTGSSANTKVTQTMTVSKAVSSSGTSAASSSMGISAHVDTQDAETEMDDYPKQRSQSDSSTNTERNLEHVHQEIKRLDKDFIERTRKEKDKVDSNKYQELVQEYLDSVSKLRGEKKTAMNAHKEKIMAKLLEKRKRHPDSSRSSSSDSDSEPLNHLVKEIDDKEGALQKELDENRKCVLDSLAKDKNKLSPDQIQTVLDEYHRNQEEVLRKRRLEREALDLKLQQQMQAQKRKQQERAQALSIEDDTQSAKDDLFYQELIQRRQRGEISNAEIGKLLEEHIMSQEEDVRKLRLEARKRQREQRKREREANPQLVHELVEQERETSKQRRQITNAEKEKADQKLKEKLKKRNQKQIYADSPDRPAPRRPPREKVAPAAGVPLEPKRKETVYENIELES